MQRSRLFVVSDVLVDGLQPVHLARSARSDSRARGRIDATADRSHGVVPGGRCTAERARAVPPGCRSPVAPKPLEPQCGAVVSLPFDHVLVEQLQWGARLSAIGWSGPLG